MKICSNIFYIIIFIILFVTGCVASNNEGDKEKQRANQKEFVTRYRIVQNYKYKYGHDYTEWTIAQKESLIKDLNYSK